jgi:hypothetical protein
MAKYKSGHKREDGKVFWRYQTGKGEIWVTEEQFARRKKTQIEYRKKAAKHYYQSVPKEKRPSYGQYDFAKNRYFIGISSSGKEVWVTKDRLERNKQQHKKAKQKYLEKTKQFPPQNAKIGDKHPTDSNLYVLYKHGNRPYYGDKAALNRRLETLRMAYIKRYYKTKKIRKERLAGTPHIKRGTERNGMYFWTHDRIGKELWLPKAKYDEKRKKELERRKKNRLTKNEIGNPSFKPVKDIINVNR